MQKHLNNPNFGLLLFRLFVGLSMAFAHGLGKIPPPEQLVQGVSSMGFPAPILFAWVAGLSEFVGGLLIAAGLFLRPATAFLGVTMAVAAFIVHANDPYNVKEMALLYFFSCILLFFVGPGNLALNRFLPHGKK